jgi:hypothetical protein
VTSCCDETSTRKKRRVLTLAVAHRGVVVLSAVLSGCRNAPPATGIELANEVQRLQQMTTPPHAEIVQRQELALEPMAMRQEWKVVTTQSWQAYVDTVTRFVVPTYECVALGPNEMRCLRFLTGDRLQLHLVRHEAPSGIAILARFEATPF